MRQGEVLQGVRIEKRHGLYGWPFHFASCVCVRGRVNNDLDPVSALLFRVVGWISQGHPTTCPHPGPSTAPGAV